MTLSPSKLVIAHRGASAYLPEHTLAAYALALGQGADGIETDVVLSADGVPVCLHDLWLETTTDVADHHDGRSRSDGHYYAIEFTFEQIAQLRAFGRVSHAERTELPRMHVVTLEDLLRLRQHLHRTKGPYRRESRTAKSRSIVGSSKLNPDWFTVSVCVDSGLPS